MTKNLSTHVTSALSAVVGVVALIHPGFTVPPFVQGLSVTVCAVISAAIQFAHMSHKHQEQTILQLAERAAQAAPPAPQA